MEEEEKINRKIHDEMKKPLLKRIRNFTQFQMQNPPTYEIDRLERYTSPYLPALIRSVADHMDGQMRLINVQLIILSLATALCMVLTNEACFDDDGLTYLQNCNVEGPMLCIDWALSLLSIWRLIRLYQLLSRGKAFRWSFRSKRDAFCRSTLKYKFSLEFIIFTLIPIPYRSSNDSNHELFTLIAFTRVYLIIRAIRDFSPIYRRRHIFSGRMKTESNLQRLPEHYHQYLVPLHHSVNFQTVLKAYFHNNALYVVCVIFLVTVFLASYAIYLLERVYWWPLDTSTGLKPITGDEWLGLTPTEQFEYQQGALTEYTNCCWFICVTMATVGYGDIQIAGIRGRFVAMVAAIIGIFTTSLIVGLITSKLVPSIFEDYVIHWEAKEGIRKAKEYAAVRLIQSAFRYHRANKRIKRRKKFNFPSLGGSFRSLKDSLQRGSSGRNLLSSSSTSPPASPTLTPINPSSPTKITRSLDEEKINNNSRGSNGSGGENNSVGSIGSLNNSKSNLSGNNSVLEEMKVEKEQALLYTRHWVKKLRELRIKELAFPNSLSHTEQPPEPVHSSETTQILHYLKQLDTKLSAVQHQQQQLELSVNELNLKFNNLTNKNNNKKKKKGVSILSTKQMSSSSGSNHNNSDLLSGSTTESA